jgi:hypothetical protein
MGSSVDLWIPQAEAQKVPTAAALVGGSGMLGAMLLLNTGTAAVDHQRSSQTATFLLGRQKRGHPGLCKCRYRRCGAYFVHPKPRRLYQHGTFCSRKHASVAAAEAAMRKLRDDGCQTLIEAAAQKLIAWNIRDRSWQDDSSLKSKLAEHLCHVISRKRLDGYQQESALKLGHASPVTRELLR